MYFIRGKVSFNTLHKTKQTNLSKKHNQTIKATSEKILVPWFGTNFRRVL